MKTAKWHHVLFGGCIGLSIIAALRLWQFLGSSHNPAESEERIRLWHRVEPVLGLLIAFALCLILFPKAVLDRPATPRGLLGAAGLVVVVTILAIAWILLRRLIIWG